MRRDIVGPGVKTVKFSRLIMITFSFIVMPIHPKCQIDFPCYACCEKKREAHHENHGKTNHHILWLIGLSCVLLLNVRKLCSDDQLKKSNLEGEYSQTIGFVRKVKSHIQHAANEIPNQIDNALERAANGSQISSTSREEIGSFIRDFRHQKG